MKLLTIVAAAAGMLLLPSCTGLMDAGYSPYHQDTPEEVIVDGMGILAGSRHRDNTYHAPPRTGDFHPGVRVPRNYGDSWYEGQVPPYQHYRPNRPNYYGH